MHLYKKEENLRSREEQNKPMQLALSTRKHLTQTTPVKPPSDR